MIEHYTVFTILIAFIWAGKRAYEREKTDFVSFLTMIRDFLFFPFVVLWEEFTKPQTQN